MQWLHPSYPTMRHPLHIQHWMRKKTAKGRELTDAVMFYPTVYQYAYSTSPTITTSTPNTLVHRKKNTVSVALTILLNGQSWYADRRCISLTYWFTYLLTYSMVQSPSWEANWFAASQEIPRILWNPKVHYRTHKRPPPVPVLGQPNPTPYSQTPSASFTPSTSATRFHTHTKQQAKLQFLYILIFKFLDSNLEDKRFCTEWY